MSINSYQKTRLLIPIVGKGSIVHIIRSGLIHKIADFCVPVIALAWDDKELSEEIKKMGYEISLMPSFHPTQEYLSVRSKINFWYLKYVLKSQSTKIQTAYVNRGIALSTRIKLHLIRLKRTLVIKINRLYIPSLISTEGQLLETEKSFLQFSKWISALKIDAIFTVTPFLVEIEWLARICKQKAFPVIASIHSFDNVTKRKWPAIFFDHYFVWNKYNRAELQRINPSLTDNDITIAGAPQFDLHYNKKYLWPKEYWEERLKVPSNKKIILYAGGSSGILENEPQYVKDIVDALDEGKIENAILLFRCHPLDNVERWKEFVGSSPHIVYDFMPTVNEKKDFQNMAEDDVCNLISTLKYSSVHVNVASTMTVDGSAFFKPQIGPYYDDIDKKGEKLMRKLYHQEHYQPIIKSGVLNLATSRQHLIILIKNALSKPEEFTNNCTKCIEEIITYQDGQSAERVNASLRKILGC